MTKRKSRSAARSTRAVNPFGDPRSVLGWNGFLLRRL